MSKNLVIVESPAKAKTIEKFLGKDFFVKSSFGHVRDLPKKNMGVDIENNFVPNYEISSDKTNVIRELKKDTKNAECVWLAADEDREGEAIAWHLSIALGLDEKKTKRIVFHEITKPAILNAIKNPRKINQNLVDAQQARRVLDRLVGYELSPVLWKKVKMGLSAGRVQSVAVRLIVEKEREINKFEALSSFKINAIFDLEKNVQLDAGLPKKLEDEKQAHDFLDKCKDAKFTVKDIEKKPGKKSPSPPFITSTLQQEASARLGFSVKQTMMVAQKLYEAGKITYMRTDSVNLSETAIGQISKAVETKFGKNYLQIRKYKNKISNAQEAHEAIRPTDCSVSELNGDSNENRLYNLIWKRSVASQMADAKIEKTVATIDISTIDEDLVATGEVLQFDGFLALFDSAEDNINSKILPPIKKGQNLDMSQIIAKENFSRSPARYTEASLVKKLEEMGIGRPSTYAPTISTIQNRNYIEKKDLEGYERKYTVLNLSVAEKEIKKEVKTEITGTERKKLFPTEIGKIVNDFLVKFFPDVVNYQFTADVEEEFDQIASGKKIWNKMIGDFYKDFHKTVENSDSISRSEASGMRELGLDPKTQKPVFVRIGKFGPMIQIGKSEDEEKPQFANMPPGKNMEDITLEEALEMFTFPKNLGKSKEGEDVLISIGRFGPYIKSGKINVSIKKDQNPFDITLDEALVMLEEKKEFLAKREVKIFEDSSIKILRGPYGIYITDGKKNAPIPKDCDKPEKLTLEEATEILAKFTPKRRRFKKK